MGGGKKKKHQSFKVDPAFLNAALATQEQPSIDVPLPITLTNFQTAPIEPPSDLPAALDDADPFTEETPQTDTVELEEGATTPADLAAGTEDETPSTDVDPAAAAIVENAFDKQDFPDPDEDPAGWHAALAQATATAKEDLAAAGLDPSDPDARKLIADAAGDQLRELTPDQLAAVSAAAGFDHPHLVGLTSPTNPLVYWANPAYPMDHKSKIAIQAAAQARYEELEQGYTVGGMTLEQLKAKEAPFGKLSEPVAPAGFEQTPWQANATQINAIKEQADAAIASSESFTGFKGGWTDYNHIHTPEEAQAVIDAYNKISAADPEDPDAIIAKQNAANQLRYAARGSLNSLPQDQRNAVIAAMGGDVEAAQYMSPRDQAALVMQGSSSNALEQAETHKAWVQRLADAHEKADAAGVVGVSAADAVADMSDPQAVAAKVQALQAVHQAGAWSTNAVQPAGEAAVWEQKLPGSDLTVSEAKDQLGITSQWQAAANAKTQAAGMVETMRDQNLSTLRQIASEAGLQNADGATRAHVQQYIAGVATGKWDPSEIQGRVDAHAAKKKTTTEKKQLHKEIAEQYGDTPAAKLAALAANVKRKPGIAEVAPPPAGSFSDRIAMITASATHKNASMAPIPAVTESVVEASAFTEIPDMHLGGTNQKKYFVDQDGQKWMLKVDPGDGYRAHMESAASKAAQLASVPTAPVIATRKAGGVMGSIQPIIKNTGTVQANPKSLTQQDVDAVVASHVSSWVVGNHDGHAGNMLRTEGGGLVTVDNGQAFKFAGKDKLDTDFNPSSAQLWNSVYVAARSNGLAPGVHVRPEAAALPVIAAFEKIPDSQWRDIFRPAAELGAKDKNAAWRPEMTKRAAKKHSIPESQVTPEQTAESFLDYVTERKKTLRADFMKFFIREGWDVRSSFSATTRT